MVLPALVGLALGTVLSVFLMLIVAPQKRTA